MDESGIPSAGSEDTVTGPMGETIERGEYAARRAVLAGIGAVATACDNAETMFDRLANRGERVRQEWRDRTDEMRRQNMGVGGRMRESVRTVMDSVFDSLNVPSKTDIDAVNVKLNLLNTKIDDLRMREPGAAETPTAEPPPPTGDLAT